MAEVCALVLTYKRKEFLGKVLDCLAAQSFPLTTILVVDNHSNDGTVEFIQQKKSVVPAIEYIELSLNCGPAGGYAAGMKWIIQEGRFTHLWVMDDDVFAEKDCLEAMLADSREKTIVYPLTKDGQEQIVTYPAWTGVLLNAADVAQAGYPIEALFWWQEDTEYLQIRLPREYGVKSVFSQTGKVTHLMIRKENKPAWQYYYQIRNSIYVRLYIRKVNYYKIFKNIILVGSKIVLHENQKTRKLYYFFLGIIHGFFKVLGKKVDPAITK